VEFDNGIKAGSLALPSVDIEVLKSRLGAGNAVLFTGAGFSLGTKNVLGDEPPLAKELSLKIAELADVEPDEDLKFTSNVFLKYNTNHTPLLVSLRQPSSTFIF
jgi:hypothetical protein